MSSARTWATWQTVPEERRVLTLPPAEHVDFEKNFVRTAVCEFRFPTLLEFEARPPDALQKALRKEYPHYERGEKITGITVGSRGAEQRTVGQHLLRSKDRKWTVIFHSSSLALETTAYRGFDSFMERLGWVLKAAMPLLDTDFFTRIGVRYINALPYPGQAEFDGWVNPALAGTIVAGPFGELAEFWQEARGPSTRGMFSFRHGLAEGLGSKREYVLDFDFYDENIDTKDSPKAIDELHGMSYRFFRWAVGPKTIAALGSVVTKKERK